MTAHKSIPTNSVSAARLREAAQRVRHDLLNERNESGHWIGELATSALATATGVSALSIVRKQGGTPAHDAASLTPFIQGGVNYLVQHQNEDGGWGDTDLSYSNIATTMLAVAALHLAGESVAQAEIIRRANQYIEQAGGLEGLKQRYGIDKTFVVPILTNYALAGLIDWKFVAPLPFELACVPQSWYRFVGMPVVSYAIPALVAIGQANYFHRPPFNPLTRWLRGASVKRSLNVLQRMQPGSGGYLEAMPLTCFVLMSLAATGRTEHPVAQNAVRFVLDSVRPDGSWPIDTNLATWVTTLSLNALSIAPDVAVDPQHTRIFRTEVLDWLLDCQYREVHPFTGAAPGGWGWSDLTGSVPDADDTPGALLTLANWYARSDCTTDERRRMEQAAANGLRWLSQLQNRDGGWPTFCRGWGKLPFDRSGTDLTAHVLRAFRAWENIATERITPALRKTMARKIQSGLRFLQRKQHANGSWSPLWFGNQERPDEDNPIYGTVKVLLAYRDLDLLQSPPAQAGFRWLGQAQNADGGWGGDRRNCGQELRSSVEETALAVEALCAVKQDPDIQSTLNRGVAWLVDAIEQNQHQQPAPIGFYFAKLWYYERLYPLIFATSALAQAEIVGRNGVADA